MQTTDLIEEQISSCRELLEVFKDERETYGDSEEVSMQLVMGMLKRKQDILHSFTQQKALLQEIQAHGHQDEESEKLLLRELGTILEQLLVIDQENEVLLRNLIGKQPGKSKPTAPKATIKQSPDLPFIPGSKKKTTTNVTTKPTVSNASIAQANLLQEKVHLFSRKKLKAYGA